jgi:hypothetical protein
MIKAAPKGRGFYHFTKLVRTHFIATLDREFYT